MTRSVRRMDSGEGTRGVVGHLPDPLQRRHGPIGGPREGEQTSERAAASSWTRDCLGLDQAKTIGEALGGATAQPSVIIPYDHLLDRASSAGLLADGTPVSASGLRRLACNADLVPVVLDSRGLLDLGRTIRLAPPHLRLAIGLRDGGCAFPGCAAPLSHCDLHHIVPWQDDGPTQPGNLVALCRVHRTLIEPLPARCEHDGTAVVPDQWQARIDSRGLPEFIPPAAVDPTRRPLRKVAGHVATLVLDDTG